MSIALALLLATVSFACASIYRDGIAAQALISTLATIATASVCISGRATDANLAARSTQGIKFAAAVPVIWMTVQLLPTPIGAHSIWGYANDALDRQVWGHISVDLGMTILALVFYLANISLILTGTFAARDSRRAELLLSALTWITALTTLILLISRMRLIPALDGTDFDEALCAVSAFCVLLSLANGVRAVEQRDHKDGNAREPMPNRLSLLTSGIALAIGLAGLGVSATVNSGLVAAFGVVTFGSIYVSRRSGLPGWGTLMLTTTMLLAAAMIVLWRYDSVSGVSPLLQFAAVSPSEAISPAQRLLSDTRWQGTGAGTYAMLLPIYQDLSSATTKVPSAAAVLAIELGWPMFFFVIAATAWLVVMLYRGALVRGRGSFYPAVAAACVVVILGQAFCDASLFHSCVAVVGSAVIGLGLAQRTSLRR